MTILARGSVTDRPWGMTLGALGLRGLSGQVAIASEGKKYVVAFSEGVIVGAYSPLASDAAVRLALTTNLITSTQVGDITRRMAAAPERDEIELLGELVRLGPEHAARLRRRLVAQRAARTFSPNQGEFVVEDEIQIPIAPGAELDVRTIIYLGAKTNLAEDRLIRELASLGAYFELKPEALDDVPQYGISAAERVVVDMLSEGAYVDEIIASHPALGDRIVRAIVYSLASCGALTLRAPPRLPRSMSPSSAPTSQQSGRTHEGVATQPRASIPRTATPSTAPATARTPTPQAPTVGRTPTPVRNAPPGQPAMSRTPTGQPPMSRTPTGQPPMSRTPTGQPPMSRTPTGQPPVSRTPTGQPPMSRTPTGQPPMSRTPTGQPPMSRTPTGQPPMSRTPTGQPAMPRTSTGQPAMARTTTGNSVPTPAASYGSGAVPRFAPNQGSGSTPVGRPRTPSTPPPGTESVQPRMKRESMQPPLSTAPATPLTPASAPPPAAAPMTSGQRSTGHAAAPRRTRRDSTAVNEIEQLLASKIPMLDKGVDHFTLLGLAMDATPEHVRNAYFTLARKLHPDRLAAIGVDDEQRRAQRLMAQVNLAFSVLNEPTKRAEYSSIVQRGGEAAVKAEEAKADEMAMAIMRAEEAFKQGEMALRREQLKQALEAFQMAAELQPKEPEYQALLAWTKFAIATDKNAVAAATRKALLAAAEANDRSPTAKFYLGRVERMLGREREALQYFQDVLAVRPSHTEAASEARVLSQRLNKR